METKVKSENQKANLEMVLESISEDLRINTNSIDKLLNSIEILNGKIDHLSSKNGQKSDWEDFLKEIKLGFTKMSDSQSKYSLAIDKLQNISEVSERNRQEQKSSLGTKIIHHHHISKGIWVAIALLILISLESAGWLTTENKLDQYIENDTKYRFLRMDTAAASLQIYLDSADAKYKSDPNMHNVVIDLEDRYRENMEHLEKAELLKQEARELERKVRVK